MYTSHKNHVLEIIKEYSAFFLYFNKSTVTFCVKMILINLMLFSSVKKMQEAHKNSNYARSLVKLLLNSCIYNSFTIHLD